MQTAFALNLQPSILLLASLDLVFRGFCEPLRVLQNLPVLKRWFCRVNNIIALGGAAMSTLRKRRTETLVVFSANFLARSSRDRPLAR